MNNNANRSSPPSLPLFPIPDVCYQPTYWIGAQVIVTLTLILVVTSNILLLLVTWRSRHTRINPWLFASLAMSDLLNGVLVLPFDLFDAHRMEASRPSGPWCTFSGILFHILQTISLFSFFALSLDRLLSIEFPLRYPVWMTWKMNVAALVVIWGVPALTYSMIPATGLGIYVYKCWQCMCNLGMVNLNYLNFLLLLSVCIFLATYMLNGRIFYVARKHSLKVMRLEQQFRAQTGKRLNIGDRMKAARSILVALSLFTLCWGPYYSALFCFVLFGLVTTPLTEFTLLWLAISNSYMNFFIFLVTYKSFRLRFFHMIGVKSRVEATETTFTSTAK